MTVEDLIKELSRLPLQMHVSVYSTLPFPTELKTVEKQEYAGDQPGEFLVLSSRG